MDTLPVTLIVKAPNQQIEDQQVQCELSWTINKLKQHLSEVYPSKPAKHEQKLIYSGQLLKDTLMLKDILRQYDGQDTHTVHLVCSPRPYTQKKQQPPPPPNTSESTQTPAATQDVPSSSGTEQRVPDTQWHHYNYENSEQLAVHMAMMQQAYWQYMTHCMNLANQNYAGALPQEEHAEAPEAAAPAAPLAPAQPPRELDQNRDWLDIFYMFSRIMVFISIVYFYSSPLRFFCVLLFAFGLYLYQIGLLRNINLNNNNILQGEGGQEERAPSRLAVVWNFFTAFFASLIPEVPNVV